MISGAPEEEEAKDERDAEEVERERAGEYLCFRECGDKFGEDGGSRDEGSGVPE